MEKNLGKTPQVNVLWFTSQHGMFVNKQKKSKRINKKIKLLINHMKDNITQLKCYFIVYKILCHETF